MSCVCVCVCVCERERERELSGKIWSLNGGYGNLLSLQVGDLLRLENNDIWLKINGRCRQ